MENKLRERIEYSAIVDRIPLKLKDDKQIIVWVIVNVENWDISNILPRMVLVPPGNKVHIPDIPNWAWQEYGMRVGIWRIYEALSSRKIQATLSINGSVCTEYPRVAKAAKELDWEFLGHSFWQRPTHLIEDQPLDIQKTANEIRSITGQSPRGWMGPGLTETFETPDYLTDAGIEYVADYPMDDQPFEIRTRNGPLISIPYTVELNDIPMMLIQHHNAEEFYKRCMNNFERLYIESKKNTRVMAIAIHPYITGVPHRIKFFEKVLDDILKYEGVLFWTGSQILDWYLECKNK